MTSGLEKGEGLFLFRRFMNLLLTYLLRHLPTYLQPWTRPAQGYNSFSLLYIRSQASFSSFTRTVPQRIQYLGRQLSYQ